MKTLDPGDPVGKIQLKASITDAIVKQVAGSNREDIGRKVENEYERLLARAVINTHIPSLTAGTVRREVTASNFKSPS